MCGIVGYVGNDAPQGIVIEGLKKLEYRGYDSAGIAVVSDGEIELRKHVGAIVNLEKLIGKENLGGHVGIGHTRWATHGAPSDVNSHPHMSADNRVALVHNGTIENYVELRTALEDEGIGFKSDTDSEVAAVLIGKYYNMSGDLKAAMDKATSEMTGTFALAAIAADEPDMFVAYRKNAPLIVGKGDGCNFVASDFSALLKYTKDVYLLENGDTVVLTPDSVTIYDETGKEIKRETMHISWDESVAEKGDFEHFMLKEIYDQPEGIMETLKRNLSDNGRVELYDMTLTKEDFAKFNKICIVACGTAYHAGLVGRNIIEKLVKIPVEVDVASEFRYRDPFVNEQTLFIAISQSGETADTLEALREAKRKGARVLSIVNVVGSSVARESDDVFYTWAGPEISVASTKAYTTQLLSLYLLALYLGDLKDTITPEYYSEIIEELAAIPGKLEEVLKMRGSIEKLAKKLYDRDQVFFIGRGMDSSVAYEGSLKLKEISYINSFAIAAGELKHGTIALMEPKTIVVALATQSKLFDKMVSNIQEVKARNAHVISIAKEGNTAIEEHSDETFYIPNCLDEVTPLLSVIPLQIYAYYVAKEKGCEIDRPRNLAKSVTVE
ncbi:MULTISPECIES: glutamine--fructose-6-phosphate transaminase (isomerizing) [Mogibacterium]|uniref:Glutamine--fructose-6-phosphate aminotransferase [isomerizing] n=1 Tax=Mogibacterium timidum TaxID=35519 RepID=A0A7Y8VRB6_9FIRM|nr:MULTISPECIES: glutamine--fructose-6-phosphate transaminase (isomerizing) [Mogibacterium]EJU19644.1 glutamine-fructose-6-phosphate transaminase (isomerizing) [Mogibacterium sp. CM50]NWO22930.1 glutamine--fructose-6-phosphate transaminase (isomerizing) [Mogibacterium timidum]